MAPQTDESSIFQSYLLLPASLPSIISFSQFQQLFPNSERSNPQIKSLYRDLQFLRSVDVDVVRENIESEVRKSGALRRQMIRTLQRGQKSKPNLQRKRKRDDDVTEAREPGDEAEVMIDNHLFGSLGMVSKKDHYHNASSFLTEMEIVCEELEREGSSLKLEAESMLKSTQESVGHLSDLRYGRFTKLGGSDADGGFEKKVVRSLKALEKACAKPS